MARTLPAQTRVINGLRELGGEINDPAGRATVVLADHVGQARNRSDLRLLAATLQRAEQAGLIERTVKGRRTYRIALVDGARKSASTQPAAAPAPAAGNGTPAPPAAEPDAIAAAFMKQLAESLNSGVALDRLRRDVASLEEKNRSLSSQLREANDELRKLRNQVRRLERAAPGGESKGEGRTAPAKAPAKAKAAKTAKATNPASASRPRRAAKKG